MKTLKYVDIAFNKPVVLALNMESVRKETRQRVVASEQTEIEVVVVQGYLDDELVSIEFGVNRFKQLNDEYTAWKDTYPQGYMFILSASKNGRYNADSRDLYFKAVVQITYLTKDGYKSLCKQFGQPTTWITSLEDKMFSSEKFHRMMDFIISERKAGEDKDERLFSINDIEFMLRESYNGL